MTSSGRFAHQPALDGVRALAVVAVLLFHAGTPGFGGGYLGVSVFFTLSGYLITSLLLNEHAATGSIGLGVFYGRRLRRLAPASLLTIAAVVLLAAVTDVFDGVVGLRGQVVGSLLQVQNWVLLSSGSSYQDLLAEASGAVSPLAHFWSLAIEEQFYWLWPPAMLLLLSRCRHRRARVRVIGVVTLAMMAAAPVIAARWGPDAAYWATPARLGEILVGAWLAAILHDRPAPGDRLSLQRVSWLAPVSLAVLAVAVVTFPAAGGPAYHGALPLVAVVSGGLILGLQGESSLRGRLSAAPMVAIGKISYGLYLVHWPVYVVVDADRTGLDGVALTALRLSITVVIALASYRLVEQPIRLSRIPIGPTLVATAAVSVIVGFVGVIVVSSGPSNYWRADTAVLEAAAIDVDLAPGPLIPLTTRPPTTRPPSSAPPKLESPTTTSTTIAPLPTIARPVRIVVTGDSTGEALGTGIVRWAAANDTLAQAQVHAAPGCGFLEGGERLWGDSMVSASSCDGWTETQLYPAVEKTTPDVVVVMSSTWDLIDRRWDGGETLEPGDADYRARLVDAYTTLVDRSVAAGASRVLFVREPVPDVWWNGATTGEADPSRHAVLASVYDEIALARPETVRVVDLAHWYTSAGLDASVEDRPDGIHLTPEAATMVVERFLGDELIRAALG